MNMLLPIASSVDDMRRIVSAVTLAWARSAERSRCAWSAVPL